MFSNERLPWLFALLKVLLHLLLAPGIGLHRDEYLYLALGRHPDWGYWSNPPLIGWLSWLVQHTLGDGVLATRLMPALLGGVFVWLVLRMAQMLGGGKWALWITAAGLFGSIAWLRVFSMLQPVPVDLLCWTLASYCLLGWQRTGDARYWIALGVVLGLGLLNKYMVVFLGFGIVVGLLFSPDRQILAKRTPYLAAAIALCLFAPNLIWQWQHGFPVVAHMRELRDSQLVNVRPLNFVLDQLMFHGPAALLWIGGLIGLFKSQYRLHAIIFAVVFAVLLLLSGKSYYTLGLYPVLFAGGGVFWEKMLRPNWAKVVMAIGLVVLPLPLIPYGLPVFPPDLLLKYYQKVPIAGALRWEDGEVHPLPQDFADMLGWEELGLMVGKAWAEVAEPDRCLVYGSNYGQAGAAEYHALNQLNIPCISFADSYFLWAPREIPERINALIYINDELGADIDALFTEKKLIGSIASPLAREQGTSVWLCTKPVRSPAAFWQERTRELFR